MSFPESTEVQLPMRQTFCINMLSSCLLLDLYYLLLDMTMLWLMSGISYTSISISNRIPNLSIFVPISTKYPYYDKHQVSGVLKAGSIFLQKWVHFYILHLKRVYII